MITFLAPILAWFGTWTGRFALGGGIVASIATWLLIHDTNIKNTEHRATIAQVERATKHLDEDGVAARKAAEKPGAMDRLRRSSCRDC